MEEVRVMIRRISAISSRSLNVREEQTCSRCRTMALPYFVVLAVWLRQIRHRLFRVEGVLSRVFQLEWI